MLQHKKWKNGKEKDRNMHSLQFNKKGTLSTKKHSESKKKKEELNEMRK